MVNRQSTRFDMVPFSSNPIFFVLLRIRIVFQKKKKKGQMKAPFKEQVMNSFNPLFKVGTVCCQRQLLVSHGAGQSLIVITEADLRLSLLLTLTQGKL